MHMTLPKPYRRTVRQLLDNTYAGSGNGRYVGHPKYAVEPEHYVRAYLLLQKDVQELFDYIEPADQNLPCYSYRIHELLLRACVEVEANCKAILVDNGYKKRADDLTMTDYIKIEKSHRLSEIEVWIPTWTGLNKTRKPFQAFSASLSPTWYRVYNAAKHDRHNEFKNATFEQMLDAVCGCVALLAAQFMNQDFSRQSGRFVTEGPGDGMEEAIGGYFRVKYASWPVAERYDFNWQVLRIDPEPFEPYPYQYP
jgi:hypothetical protein